MVENGLPPEGPRNLTRSVDSRANKPAERWIAIHACEAVYPCRLLPQSMTDDLMRYDLMAQRALRGVVKLAIERAAEGDLPGEHHFYVAFVTTAPGVTIPDHLLREHPE